MKTRQQQRAVADTAVLRLTPSTGNSHRSADDDERRGVTRLDGGAQQQPPQPQGGLLDTREHGCCRSSRVQPVPLWKARDILLEAVLSGSFVKSAELEDGEAAGGAGAAAERVFFRRLEVKSTLVRTLYAWMCNEVLDG